MHLHAIYRQSGYAVAGMPNEVRPMRLIAALALSGLLLACPSASACSTFATRGAHGFVVGRNMDNELPVAGLVLVNKRGVRKALMPWATLAPAPSNAAPREWNSRYGSVTLTAIGRDFPDGGMNEMGLVVEEMSLGATAFPSVARGSAMSQSQWIQYQLDTFASVREVLEHLDAVAMSGWGWHFLISDASGDCVALEFLEGQAITGRDARISGCVLTNDSVSDSREHLSRFKGFGGSELIPDSRDSLSRFVRAAGSLAEKESHEFADDVAFGFQVLESIDQGAHTQRSVVHEVTSRRFHFRTLEHRAIKFVDLNKLDFSAATPTLMIDIETPLTGDITGKLVPYTAAENRRVVESFLRLVHLTEGAAETFTKDLKAAGMSEEQYVELMSRHPETLASKEAGSVSK